MGLLHTRITNPQTTGCAYGWFPGGLHLGGGQSVDVDFDPFSKLAPNSGYLPMLLQQLRRGQVKFEYWAEEPCSCISAPGSTPAAGRIPAARPRVDLADLKVGAPLGITPKPPAVPTPKPPREQADAPVERPVVAPPPAPRPAKRQSDNPDFKVGAPLGITPKPPTPVKPPTVPAEAPKAEGAPKPAEAPKAPPAAIVGKEKASGADSPAADAGEFGDLTANRGGSAKKAAPKKAAPKKAAPKDKE